MNINNKRHIVIYLVSAGIMAYFLMAGLSAIFITPVEMGKGWCLEWKEFEVRPDSYEKVCITFKNSFEEVKSFHNLQMLKRNDLLYSYVYYFFLLCSIFIFYFIPKWNGNNYEGFGVTFLSLIVINIIVIYIISKAIGYILPPPIEWFPDIFVEINDRLTEATLQDLQESQKY